MQAFTIITPVQAETGEQIEIAVQSFARFYFSISSRHRAFVQMVLIDNGDWFHDIVRLVEAHRIKAACQVILQEKATLQEHYLHGSFLVFLPAAASDSGWIKAALEKGAPVIGYEGLVERTMLDNSCSMLLSNKEESQIVEEFSEILKMVYFDPGALKMLRRGARRKYFNILPLYEAAVFSKVA
jgi:hypothetical protein